MPLRDGLLQFLLIAVVAVYQLPAQVENPAGPESSQANSAAQAAPSRPAPQSESESESSSGSPIFTEWPVLVIPGVTNVAGLSGSGLLIGAGISGGYGWIDTGTPQIAAGTESGYISVAQPYAGVFQAGPRHKALLEYSPTIDLYNNGGWDGSVLQRGELRFFDDLSRRWRWVFSGYSTYGTEYLRELGGLANGEYAGWLTFSSPTDKLFVAEGTTGLHWRRKPLQEFSINVNDSYSSIKHGPHYQSESGRAQMTNYFGHDSNWFAYTQANRYSNQPNCSRVGGGGGFVWNASSSTTLSLEGGPEFGIDCIDRLTAAFGGLWSQRFASTWVFYLTARRDLAEPYLLQSRWTDIFQAKLWHKTSQNTTLAGGAAYVQSSELSGVASTRYKGFLLFSEFNWRLSESLKLVGTYRYFKRDFSEPGFEDRHNWVFCSIVWHPLSRGERR